MGWAGGTKIFDAVIQTIELNTIATRCFYDIVGKLYIILIDNDWDTFNESKYYNIQWVQEAIKIVDPTVFKENIYNFENLREVSCKLKMIDLSYDTIVHNTDKATLIDFGDEQKWVPDSLIKNIEDGIITVPLWFAENEELEGYEI